MRPQDTPLASDAMVAAAIERLADFDFIGTLESYTKSLKDFDQCFGTSVSEFQVRENASYMGDLSRDDLEDVFTPLVERDRLVYQWVAQRD